MTLLRLTTKLSGPARRAQSTYLGTYQIPLRWARSGPGPGQALALMLRKLNLPGAFPELSVDAKQAESLGVKRTLIVLPDQPVEH